MSDVNLPTVSRRKAIAGGASVALVSCLGIATAGSAAAGQRPGLVGPYGIYGYGYPPALDERSYRNEIKKIQRRLHVPADGIIGARTDRAIRNFQRAHHLPVDGIVGPRTAEAMGFRWLNPGA